jgi:hypothetical protein
MDLNERAKKVADGQHNARSVPRHGVDAVAQVLLISHGATYPCRLVDLSLHGCRLCTQERFPAGAKVRVEVSFKVRGLAFRFSGITQWTDGRKLAGIRFVDVPLRRMEELVETLGEVEAENCAKAAEEAARLEHAAAADAKPADGAMLKAKGLGVPKGNLGPAAGSEPVKPAGRERRVQSREAVDTSAIIHLINVASRLPGQIVDLSLDGCRIRMEQRFPVGIYTRVETEFFLGGLPFRLGGVIQAIHDRERRSIGIRFLDTSERKREQVEQLIEEIREAVTRD